MGDPLEGLTPDGHIRTGAHRARIPGEFLPLLRDVNDRLSGNEPGLSLYVYGSVANGTARPPASDVDLLTVGLAADRATALGHELSARWRGLCRGVEITTAMPHDFVGEHDEAYGGRVFLHHYCVHLEGPDLDRASAPFRGDARAARGFNGDIARHVRQWRTLVESDPALLGRRIARKSLLAVAGLVSVVDATWTTDRERAVRRWAEIDPGLATGLQQLFDWSCGHAPTTRADLTSRFDDTVDPIVERFAADIGLWPD